MCADVTYAPIAAEGLLFVPSNVTDQVMACDLATGVVKWQLITEGPVRLAPAYGGGNVYFGSDDGHLYCVSARAGELRWKMRGAPESHPDSRMLVNGRLCSRWPVRGAPVIHEGVVYFGAGIWPEEGVYVCAVRLDTGKLLWRSDAMSYVKDGMSDHGRPYDLSLPPQGYLAVIGGKLAVPSGRSLAAWFDLATGRMEPYTCFYSKHNPPRGTWYLSGTDNYFVQGGNWFGTRSDAAPPMPPELKDAKSPAIWSRQPTEGELHVVKNRPFLNADTYRLHPENSYIEPVLTSTRIYTSEFADELKYLVPRGHTQVAFPDYDRIVARDLTHPQWRSIELRHISYARGKGKVKLPRLEFPVLWELKSPLRVLVKAGNRLYAGGKDIVAAIAIPKESEGPQVAWQEKIEGTPVNALVADGKLVVVTETGNVYCFGPNGRNPAKASASRARVPRVSPRSGYACLLGWCDGARAKTLARERDYRVIVFEPDAAKAAEAREDLVRAALYGRQIQVLQHDLASVLLTPYWANLVVAAPSEPETTLSVALDVLRPYTGELLLPGGQRRVDLLKRLMANRTGYAVRTENGDIVVHRQSPPEGADDWTHEAGGPENCFASADRLVRWPLGVLWYSGDIDRYFTPASHFQHERHPYPLVIGGRMFIVTHQYVHAVDIYTGSYLWKAEMPLTPWIRTRFFDSRSYGRPTERNCMVAPDWVYAVTGEKIHAYDTATGEQQKVFDIPARLRDEADRATPKPQEKRYHGHRAEIRTAPHWTEVRLWNDRLLAMLGQHLVALDRHSGDVCWMRRSTRATTTYAIGDDTLFGLDCDVPKSGGGGTKAQQPGEFFAMSPATGEIAWRETLEYAPVPAHNVRNPRAWLRPIIPTLSYNAKHGLIVMAVNRNDLHVFSAADGSPVWSKTDAAKGNIQGVYPPAVTENYVLLSSYKGCFAYLLDIKTGKEVGPDTGIPRPRTCARVIGNNHLLVYRDASTELYDIDANRMVRLNSVRSGCTTSFIPAGGIMTAPMLGHGCVCNYPMFASLGLYHWPQIDKWRPAAVTKSWANEAKELLSGGTQSVRAGTTALTGPFATVPGKKIDTTGFHLANATIKATGSVLLFSTKDQNTGYAVRACAKPMQKAVFSFSVKRAPRKPGQRRHGNAFFVCGKGTDPKGWIECRLYYGGRSSMMITGVLVKPIEAKKVFGRTVVFPVTVTIDCSARTVIFEAAGNRVTSQITEPLDAITHYGYGGGNSDNLFTDIAVR